MKKPKPTTFKLLDYNDCCEYIDKKYNIHVRDYAGKYFGDNPDQELPFLDFWHWVLHEYKEFIHNGCVLLMDVVEDKEHPWDWRHPDWVKEILSLFAKEFSKYTRDGCLEFWIEW